MTKMKEKAVRMIERLSDDKVLHLVKIMEGLEGLGNDSKFTKKKEALENIQKFRGRLPEDFDYKKELEDSRRERYENIG